MSSARYHLFVVLLVVAACAAAPSASANGDPASDYLLDRQMFLPFESSVSDAASTELTDVLAAAKKAGMEVRVAVIATPTDLGAVPILYKKPQRYADFLGRELVYYYKKLLLVVMPNGYGLYRRGATLADEKAALEQLPVPDTTDGTALAEAASKGVRAIASERGVTLPDVAVQGSSSSATRDRLVIVAAVVVLAAAALAVRQIRVRRRHRSSDAA